MYVKSARFVISNTDIEKCPNNNLPDMLLLVDQMWESLH